MKIIGISGGIASGKNFVAEIFAKKNAAIFDADKIVHQLLDADKSTIAAIKKIFPKSFEEEKINRKILGKIVFSDVKKLQILEKIIHEKVRKEYQKFLDEMRAKKIKIAILNVPLLLEKQGYECDKIIAILTSPSIQKKRFFSRFKNENKAELEKRFSQIKKLQLNNKQRKSKADFVINTSGSKLNTIKQISEIYKKL